MVALLSPYTSVVNAFSPLVVTSRQNADAWQHLANATSPYKMNESAINTAFVFSPMGNLSLLTRPSANVLLTEQASSMSADSLVTSNEFSAATSAYAANSTPVATSNSVSV